MSKVITDLPIEAGLFTEQSERGAKGRWKDADKVRFRYGLPEKIGGWSQLEPQFLGLARRMHDWSSLDGRQWTAIGTDKKLYLWQNEVLYDITPVRLEVALSNPFSTTAGSTTVVVAHTGGHGAQLGDYVRFEDASAVGGLDLNGEFEITAIVSFEEYEIEAASAAGSSVLGAGGTVTAKYDISVGGADSAVGFGWGVGKWSHDAWSTPRSRASQLIPARTWSLDNWGEDLIANPNGKAIYWWDRTSGPDVRAVVLDSAPSRCNTSIISQRDRQLFALGCTDYVSGAFDPLLIRYCSREDFNDWIPSDTNTAGDLRLFRGSKIVTGVRTRAELLVFTDVSVHSVNYLGEGLLYGINVVGENVSIISPNAAVAVDHRVMFMGEADFFLYDGVLRVLPCPVRNHVFSRMDKTQKVKIHAGLNREFNEVWWFYPVEEVIEPEPQPAPSAQEVNSPLAASSSSVYAMYYDERTETYYAGGIVGRYMTSPDGINWTEAAEPLWVAGGSNVVTEFHYGNGAYLAFGQTRVSRSYDGQTWTELALPAQMGEASAFGNGVFVSRNHNTVLLTKTIYYSPDDGTTWVEAVGYSPLSSLFNFDFHNGIFIASAKRQSDNAFILMTSPNGADWTEIVYTTPRFGWFLNILFEDGQYVGVTYNGDVLTSDDLTSWTLEYQTPDGQSDAVIGIRKLGKYYFVVQHSGGITRTFYSENLTEWFEGATLNISVTGRLQKAKDDVFFSESGGAYGLYRVEGPDEVVQPASEITDYVCLNIEEGTWTYGTLPRTAWTDASPVLEKPYAASTDGYLYKHETGVDANGVAMNAFIESYDMEIPEAGEMFTHIDQLIPDFLTLEGSVDLTLKGKKYPHEPDYQVKGPYLVDPTIQKVSTRIRARQVALRVESDALGDKWRLATIRGRLRAHGKRA